MHIEILAWAAVQPNTGASAVAVAGNSLVVKNSLGSKTPRMAALWGFQQVAGFQRIIAPSFHDTTNGYSYNVNLAELDPRLPRGLSLHPQAQETLSITVAGSNVAGDAELGAALMVYPNVPGMEGRYIDWPLLMKHQRQLTTIRQTITFPGVALGGFGGDALITAAMDLLHANTDYAVLGFTTSVDVGAICLLGPDTSNVRIGCPGDSADVLGQQDWFCNLSREMGMPLIPVINSGNKANTFFSVLGNENAASPVITCYLMELDRVGVDK